MFDLKDVTSWRKCFGLYPIQIRPTNIDQYALLNDGRRDFCIDLNPQGDIDLYNSYAWSANAKNYLTISEEYVIIYNWLKSSPEKIKTKYVENNIATFYGYLGTQAYSTGNDVVPFIINLFRKMRNITREKQSPIESLNLLYTLLLSLDNDLNALDYNRWNIEQTELPEQFETFVHELKNGIGCAQPNLSIILRHCSGPIFQEAHRVIQTFYSDRDLFGNISSKLIGSQKEYSSSHYTPQYVARSVVEQCLKQNVLTKETIRIFDPACGSAEFLIEILKQLHTKQYAGSVVVKGWDSSDSAISTSQFLLNYEKESVWHDRLIFDIHIVEDSLNEDWGIDNDIILMNPPFISWELLNKAQREVVSECLSSSISRPNQAIAFFRKAVNALSVNGILGSVMPTSLFESDSYKCVREELNEELKTIFAAKLGNFIFDNALTDVSIYIGKKEDNILPTKLLWCRNEEGVAQEALCALRKMEAIGLVEQETERYSIYSPIEYPDIHNSWKIIPRSACMFKDKLNNAIKRGLLVRLQSIFTVKQGIRTGWNDMFIINSDEFEMMSDKEKSFYRKSIDNGAIWHSKLEIKNYVWFPYSELGIIITSENQLREECPKTYDRLIRYKNKLESRSSLGNKEYWWALSRHRDWLLKNECRLVSTEFGNTKSFSLDIKGDCVIERGYAWIPKKEFKSLDYFFYLAVFSSSVFEKILSIYTRQLAGGNWYDFAARSTNSIPIPDVHSPGFRDTKIYTDLVSLGQVITEESSCFYTERINELAAKLYE